MITHEVGGSSGPARISALNIPKPITLLPPMENLSSFLRKGEVRRCLKRMAEQLENGVGYDATVGLQPAG